ncbi:MAG: F0F1 ATP synthase subunit delta [Pseudonocardiales bacterium]|nr:MAG: F0F1 ATP synthase subunit delta [Pseudonocardiales bacterium]
MRAASRESLASLRERLEGVTARFSTADGLIGLGEDLYAVVGLLVAQPQVRRMLSDPTTPPEGRAELAARLFDGKIGASSLQLVRDAVALRWSSSFDLLDGLETTADYVLLGAAEQAGELDEVEDELFRFERILDAESRLATTLDNQAAAAKGRVTLARQLVGDKVRPITLLLLEQAVASRRKHSVTLAVDDLLQLAAARRERSMARVIAAVALTAAQESRLAAVLSELYGRAIDARVAVDPSVRGGLVIRVGDEVIDGSIAARLAKARAALAN